MAKAKPIFVYLLHNALCWPGSLINYIRVFFGLCFKIHILGYAYVIYSYQLISLRIGHQQYPNNSFKIFNLKIKEENKIVFKERRVVKLETQPRSQKGKVRKKHTGLFMAAFAAGLVKGKHVSVSIFI